jgi:hypothetical protein
VTSFVQQMHDALERENLASHHIERLQEKKDDYVGRVGERPGND